MFQLAGCRQKYFAINLLKQLFESAKNYAGIDFIKETIFIAKCNGWCLCFVLALQMESGSYCSVYARC